MKLKSIFKIFLLILFLSSCKENTKLNENKYEFESIYIRDLYRKIEVIEKFISICEPENIDHDKDLEFSDIDWSKNRTFLNYSYGTKRTFITFFKDENYIIANNYIIAIKDRNQNVYYIAWESFKSYGFHINFNERNHFLDAAIKVYTNLDSNIVRETFKYPKVSSLSVDTLVLKADREVSEEITIKDFKISTSRRK